MVRIAADDAVLFNILALFLLLRSRHQKLREVTVTLLRALLLALPGLFFQSLGHIALTLSYQFLMDLSLPPIQPHLSL